MMGTGTLQSCNACYATIQVYDEMVRDLWIPVGSLAEKMERLVCERQPCDSFGSNGLTDSAQGGRKVKGARVTSSDAPN